MTSTEMQKIPDSPESYKSTNQNKKSEDLYNIKHDWSPESKRNYKTIPVLPFWIFLNEKCILEEILIKIPCKSI